MASPAAVLTILVNAQTAGATGKLTRLNSQLKATEAQASRSSGAVGSKFAGAAKTAGVAAGALAVYGLAKAVKVGADFEKQMDSLGAVSNATGKQMKKMEKQALDLGESTAFTANEVAKAQTELAKGGLSVKKIYGGGLKAALNLAAAGEMELAEAADTTVNVMNMFGLKGKDAGKVADMLATASNKTTAEVSDFAMALKQGGSVAKLTGQSMNDTVTILEALAKASVKNSDAGTSMKTSMLQLINPSTKQAELTKELGLNWETQAGTLKGAVGITKELQRVTEGMTKVERGRIFATLAGSDGVRTLNALYNAGVPRLESYRKANEKQGTAQDIARKKMDNLTGDAEQLTGALETSGIKLSKVFIPALRSTAQWLTNLIQKVNSVRLNRVQHELGLTNEDMKNLAKAARFLGDAWDKYMGVVKDRTAETFKFVSQILKTDIGVIRGFVKIVSGLLEGDLGKAWGGVKDIFRTGVDAVIGFLENLIDALNKIPGIDIGPIRGGTEGPQHSLGADKGEGRKGPKGVHQQHRYSGGAITKPMAIVGEEAPRFHEWVIATNPAYRKNNLAYWAQAGHDLGVPGFFAGGVLGKAGDAIGSVVNKGAGFFLDKLPKPNLPEPFSGLGPYVIGQVTDFIKDGFKSKKLGKFTMAPGVTGYKGPPANMKQLGDNRYVDSHTLAVTALLDKMFGLEMSSGFRSVAHNAEIGGAVGSLHTHGSPSNPGATDSVGPMGKMQAYIAYARQHVAGLQEAMVDNVGNGWNAHLGFFKKGGRLPSWVHGSSTLSADQLATLAHYVGMPNPGLMSQIAQAESSGNPGVTNSIGARGLWQIIPSTAEAVGANYASLTDPLANARAAAKVLSSQGLDAWEGYTNGNYASFPKGRVMALGGAGLSKKERRERQKKIRESYKFGLQGYDKGGRKHPHARTAVSLPGLKPTALPSSAKALPKSVQGLLKSPGLGYGGKIAITETALEKAGSTREMAPVLDAQGNPVLDENGQPVMKDTYADDRAILKFQMDLFQKRRKGLRKALKAVNAALGKKGLTGAQRQRLLQKRQHIFDELQGVEGQIHGVKDTLGGFDAEEGESAGETDAQKAAREALEANTAAIEQHNQELKGVQDELAKQTAFATEATATNSAVAWKALSDILSGNLGARSFQQSQTAGNGSLGSY